MWILVASTTILPTRIVFYRRTKHFQRLELYQKFPIIQYTKTKVVVINPLTLECLKMKRISKERRDLAVTVPKTPIKVIEFVLASSKAIKSKN
jgi:hypothetical protein